MAADTAEIAQVRGTGLRRGRFGLLLTTIDHVPSPHYAAQGGLVCERTRYVAA